MVIWSTLDVVTPPKRRLSAAERRERILDAATSRFAVDGYDATSMPQIAERAGISVAVVYDHFTSKAELQTTLLERHTKDLLTAVASALVDQQPLPHGELFEAGVDAFYAFVEQHPYAWRLIFRDPPSDPTVAATHTRIHREATMAIAQFLRDSVPSAYLNDSQADRDIEMIAEGLKMAMNGLARWWYDHRDVPRQAVVGRIVDMCWTGLERHSQREI